MSTHLQRSVLDEERMIGKDQELPTDLFSLMTPLDGGGRCP